MNPLFAFQLRRVARNKQFVFFTVLLPALFTIFLTKIIGGQMSVAAERQEVSASIMVSMMAYGAIGAALGATIRISFDRASGWLRQLRVTPVPQTQVFAVDVAVGVLLTLPSILVVALVGRLINGVELGVATWVTLIAVLWAGSAAFVALGILVGLSLDEKAAGGAIGILGVVLAALGGLWWPVEMLPGAMRGLAYALPSYWYAELGRGVVFDGFPGPAGVLAIAAYTAAFGALAVLVARRRPLYAVAG
ncbi:ABC transporter permease [Blastococcus xanthinilyticus]|uniref:Transport permease protein n=1 Tax=Blastococcus xanthinilyticus TaxID=1564164 RepID=A0A5S5CYS1_9ACTN|nr:ABC transporter permease [Blastococcus xanthinilyticus]TYP87509.1 ABC-2 type transport system permease protein [Blastococcus xanthinilyticus]